jgi:hypothetical protein
VAKQVLTNVRLFVGPTDLTGVSNKVEFADGMEEKDTTNFGSSGAKEVLGGLESLAFSGEGQWQAGSTSTVDVDDEMWGDRRVVQAYSVFPIGATVGNPAYLTQALRLSSKLFAAVGDVAPWMLTAVGSYPAARGMVLASPGTAVTVDANGTGVNLGAVASTQRLYATLHVLSVAGTTSPTLAVTVQSATSGAFSSPTTRLTFTTAAATGSELKRTSTGAITDTWYRAVFDVTDGGGGDASFLVAMAIGTAN